MGAVVAIYVMRESFTCLKSTFSELRASADDSEGVRLMTALGLDTDSGSCGTSETASSSTKDSSVVEFDTEAEEEAFTFTL
jgi:hypothetical protein